MTSQYWNIDVSTNASFRLDLRGQYHSACNDEVRFSQFSFPYMPTRSSQHILSRTACPGSSLHTTICAWLVRTQYRLILFLLTCDSSFPARQSQMLRIDRNTSADTHTHTHTYTNIQTVYLTARKSQSITNVPLQFSFRTLFSSLFVLQHHT